MVSVIFLIMGAFLVAVVSSPAPFPLPAGAENASAAERLLYGRLSRGILGAG